MPDSMEFKYRYEVGFELGRDNWQQVDFAGPGGSAIFMRFLGQNWGIVRLK